MNLKNLLNHQGTKGAKNNNTKFIVGWVMYSSGIFHMVLLRELRGEKTF